MQINLPFKIQISLLLFLICTTASAQINNTEFQVNHCPQTMEVCQGIYHTQTHVQAKTSGLTDFIITYTLPPGITYESGSVTIVNAPSGYSITQLNSNSSNPEFSISNTATWNVSDEVIFTIGKAAKCSAVDHSLNSGTFKDSLYISYTLNNTPKTDSDTDPTVNTYEVNYGVLSILPITPYILSVSNNATRDITIRQGGLGCVETFEYIVVAEYDLADYTISYNSTQLTPYASIPDTSGTADSLFYSINLTHSLFNTVGNGDSCFDNGEEIILQESFTLIGCDSTSSFHHANWGCDTVCQKAVRQEGVVNITNEIPNVTRTIIANPPLDMCDTVTYIVEFTNTGGGVATDFAMNIGLSGNTSTVNIPYFTTLWGSDWRETRYWDNIKLNGLPLTQDSCLIHHLYVNTGCTSYIPANFYNSNPDGPGGLTDADGDGFYDDLEVGNTIEVSFDAWIEPDTSIACGNTGSLLYMHPEAIYLHASYFNQCGENLSTLGETWINYNFIVRNRNTPSTLDGPIDVDHKDVFLLDFFPRLQGWGSGPYCNGEHFLTSQTSSWTVTMDLPPGFNLDPTAQPNPDHGPLNPTIQQIGNQIIYTIDYYNQNDTFPFLLQLCCDSTTRFATIPVTSQYQCKDNLGNICWESDIHCLSIDLVTHCPGGSCVGVTTNNFDATNVTPMWEDNSMTTWVVEDSDYYYPHDTMLITSKGTISDTTLSDLFFEITYSNTAYGVGDTNNINLIQLESATIEIGDVSNDTVHTFPITILPTPTVSGSDEFSLIFDLSPFNEMVSPNYLYDSGDSIIVQAKFKIDDDFVDQQQHLMTNFSGIYHTFTAQGNRIQCDYYSDRAWFEKTNLSARRSSQIKMYKCEEKSVTFLYRHLAASSDNYDNPDLYRPAFRTDSFKLELTPDIRFTGKVVPTAFSTDYYYDSINHVLTIYPDSTWKNQDKIHSFNGRLIVDLIGTCETSDTPLEIPFYWHFTKYFYHPDISVHESDVRSDTLYTILYHPPTFSIQAQKPIVNGIQQTASWDVDICNTMASGDIEFNWLNIDDNMNVQIVSVEDVTAGGSTALTYTYSPDGIYTEIGALNSTECKTIRISATYSDCTTQTIDVNHNWDCQYYPDTLANDNPDCYRVETLQLIPQPAQIQLDITKQPNVITLCSLLTYELEINSAQLADVVNPSLSVLTSNAPGITINSMQVEYPTGSGNTETLNPTINQNTQFYTLNDHTAILANNGISGTGTALTPQDRKATVTFKVMTDCNFVSGATLFFQVGGKKPCGEPAIGDQSVVISDNLTIPQAVDLYDANVDIDINPQCDSSAIVDVQIFIAGGTTTGNDSSYITLPAGTTFSTFNCTGVFCPLNYTVTTVNNQQVIQLEIPTGMSSGDRLEFSFEVTANAGYMLGSTIQIVNTTILNNITCGNGLCNTINAQTGTGMDTLNIGQLFGISSVASNDVRCFGGNDGTATALPSGGNSPYTYEWDNNANNQMAQSAFGLGIGTYVVTVTDNNGCVATASITISQPTLLEVIVDAEDVLCPWSEDGSIELLASGGVPAYNYQWWNGQTVTTVTGLAVGTYKATVSDDNNCKEVVSVYIDSLGCEPCVDIDICLEIGTDPNHPISTIDSDGDGVSNFDECADGTDPCIQVCPDLSPVLRILPSNISGIQNVAVIVEVHELNGVETDSSLIKVRIPSDPRHPFVWQIGLTQVGPYSVQNSHWNYNGGNGLYHQWTYNGPNFIFQPNMVSTFGYEGNYDPQSTNGTTTITATVFPFSGGECNILNNTDSERLVYFY